MANVNPLLLVGAVIGVVTALLVLAYALVKDKKETMDFERTMNDGEILRRLAGYAKPYLAKFVVVLFLMLFSIAYDIISPLIVGALEELVSGEFELPRLFAGVAVYAGVLVFSMASTYFQAVILQRVGQRIISDLREDLFTHIESLSHEQLNEIPVGKLVTRVTNDTNAISMMFTNLLVTLTKNIFVILGILVAMLALNYDLTLMVLCFVPFIVIFTVIFRKFSRRAYRKVKDATTDINTYLSEHLSGMKIIQIFNRESKDTKQFEEKNDALYRAGREQILVFGVFRPLVYMLYVSSVLCLFYFSCKSNFDGAGFMGTVITSELVVAFYMYTSKFFNPIQSLAEQFHRLQSAFASAEKIFTVYDIEPSVKDEPDAVELETVRGEIEFRNVTFAYSDGTKVGAKRRFVQNRSRTDGGVRRRDGLRKNHHSVASCKKLRHSKRRNTSRRRQHKNHQIVVAQKAFRADAAGRVPVFRHHKKQHSFKGRRFFGRRNHGNLPLRQRRQIYRQASGRAGRRSQGARQQLFRRPTPAAELCENHDTSPRSYDSGRGHRKHRHRNGSPHSG